MIIKAKNMFDHESNTICAHITLDWEKTTDIDQFQKIISILMYMEQIWRETGKYPEQAKIPEMIIETEEV